MEGLYSYVQNKSPPAYFLRKIFQHPRSYYGPPLINFSTFLEEICKKVDAVSELPK